MDAKSELSDPGKQSPQALVFSMKDSAINSTVAIDDSVIGITKDELANTLGVGHEV